MKQTAPAHIIVTNADSYVVDEEIEVIGVAAERCMVDYRGVISFQHLVVNSLDRDGLRSVPAIGGKG